MVQGNLLPARESVRVAGIHIFNSSVHTEFETSWFITKLMSDSCQLAIIPKSTKNLTIIGYLEDKWICIDPHLAEKRGIFL